MRSIVGLSSFLGAPAIAAPPVPCPPAVAPIYPYCPPAALPGSIPSLTTPGTLPGTDPGAAPLPNGAESALRDGGFSRSAEGGGQSAASASPSMDGDLLGARSLRLRYSVPFTATFGSTPGIATGGPSVTVNPNANGSNIFFGPTPNGTTRTAPASFSSGDLTYVQPTTAAGASFDRDFAKSALQTLLSTGQLTNEQVNQLNKLSPADRAKLIGNRGAVNSAITKSTGGLGIPQVTVSSVDGQVNPNGTITYTAILTGERTIALPGSSSTVGRVKLSEDNNPLPRDRVMFGYDRFSNVPFTESGITVNRFMFGFEKTFLDGRWSAEVRLPFAGTLASTYTDGFATKDVELGNMRFALKHLWTRSDVLNFSSGVGVTVPTAKDQVVLLPQGGELYRFKNESVTVEPFLALLYTPTNRFFAQAWSSVNFDTSGGTLTYNKEIFGGSGSSRIYDVPYLALDGQIGYWLVRSNAGAVRGLAPFVELHYNYAIAQIQLLKAVSDVSEGQGLQVTGIGNTELTLTAGVVAQIYDHVNLTIGASAPLLQRPDRTFDAQFGLRLNYFFGATARQRSAGYQVSGF